ncbi:hypothetical protein EYZ11_007363 [Aspergillus tanneri]|uniref:Uncharacterized protein n=1 Tax=Aspergillus tanneri TaxID=1220188 RepID=A0A4V3UNZ7_9EURO|nr:hypothetical protein EYZ11_007363 [Aspergillus tanneri]
MLECDTKLMTSPLTKGYLWLVHPNFPFPAYILVLQDLRKWPTETERHADKAWEAMSDNYATRMMNEKTGNNPLNDEQSSDAVGMNVNNMPMPITIDFSSHGLQSGTVMSGQAAMEVDMDQIDWTTIDWNSIHAPGW